MSLKVSALRSRVMIAGACVGAVALMMSCGTTDPKEDEVTKIGFSDVQALRYDSLTFTIAPVGSGTTIFSAVGMPESAKLDAATGVFSWTPTVADFGTHTLSFTATNGSTSSTTTKTITVEKPALPPGAVFKMVTPNGGETYAYGDTITCLWLQNINVCKNGMLQVINGFNYCDYYSQSIPDRLTWPRDSMVTTGYKYFRPVDDSTVIAVVKVGLVDKQLQFADCQTTFGNATNAAETKFRAYDEYKPVGCTNCYDDSDAPFTVAK